MWDKGRVATVADGRRRLVIKKNLGDTEVLMFSKRSELLFSLVHQGLSWGQRGTALAPRSTRKKVPA